MQAGRRNVESCGVLNKPQASNVVTATLHGREAEYIRQDISLTSHVILQRVQIAQETT
jgi:hypothetical protein